MSESPPSDRPGGRAWRRRPFSMFMATIAGVGHLPGAPGTYASILAIPLVYGLSLIDRPTAISLFMLLCVGAVFWAERAERALLVTDSDHIVIDEVVGVCMTFVYFSEVGWPELLVGLVVFRICDIAKPPGVRYFDQAGGGGFAIIMDDIVAGLYAIPAVALVRWLLA